MSVPARLERYIETDKQQHFSRDFMTGWQDYETWEGATVGQSGLGQRSFKITEEDILSYNRACGEVDPLMINPEYARKNSPTGELLQHPIFVTTIAFYSSVRRASALGSALPVHAIRNSGSESLSRSATAKSSARPSRRSTSSHNVANPTCRCSWISTTRAMCSKRVGGAR